MPQGIARYGLEPNPYLVRPLDPLDPQEDARLRAPQLPGLRTLTEVEEYIDCAVKEKRPAFVLIYGEKKTGRTSVCNHLLAHYRKCRDIPLDNFVVPDREFQGQADFEIMANWLTSLYSWLEVGGLAPLQGDGTGRLDTILKDTTQLDAATYRSKLPPWLKKTGEILVAKGNSGFAVCIEDVKDYCIVEAAFALFAHTQTLVVMTVVHSPDAEATVKKQYQLHVPSNPAGGRSRYPLIEPRALRGTDASALIEQRWGCGTIHPPPFPQDGLSEAFDDYGRPAGIVLKLADQLLRKRAALAGEGPVWPEEREALEFSGEQITALLRELEQPG